MSQERSVRRKWLLRAAQLLIIVLVVWAVRRTLYEAWNQAGQHRWQFQPGWLIVSGGLYLLGLLPDAVFWHRVLRVLGQDVRFGEILRPYYVGHLGKYVPGKAMVVVLRTAMVRGRGVDAAVVAVSVFVETLTMMAVGAFLAAAILAIGFHASGSLYYLYGSLGLMVVAGLPTLPPVFKRLVRLAGVGKSDPAVAEKIERLGFRTLLTGWLLVTLSWLCLGLSYWALLKGMGVPDLHPVADLPRYTASVALALVAGFVVLVLPGGVGVREAALVELMIPYLEVRLPAQAQLAAWASAAILRLVWVLSEVVISAALYLWRPARSSPTT